MVNGFVSFLKPGFLLRFQPEKTLGVVVGGWGWLTVGLGLGLFRSPLGLAQGFYVELPRESGQLVLAGGWWGEMTASLRNTR